MKKIVIVGAGGMAREIIGLLAPLIQSGQVAIRGLIDDTQAPCESFSPGYPHPILGGIAQFTPQADDEIIIAIGDPAARLRIGAELRARGGRFYTLIHPLSVIAPDAKIGEGVIIYPYSLISANTQLADFVVINVHSGAGHDVSIGEGSVICAHVDLTGFVQVGRGVLVGSHASILPKVKLGEGSRIGAGSIVVRSVKAGATVFCQPARTLQQST
ncbi:NeuD/PglB/VioB family sugar acetyltransferase [Roseateles asaccharophilus]|uniref:Sugar O-acyltransferase (Sialic acid O-acetyltransferase NeuD family) n=1 Tax=Roseateles asaccharophilus TaxID=582607 RepID=A0ABU2ABV5_9BURK|nr:NeuD/PglB/VioB family sugar acetyltransferase [Roseateles asaccharophilus]MDR7334699.1 sugar O-acyltransferase (sialic acid O-acetyltransferase NeuD family) [Roseateles asaccharophilus]